MSIAPKCQYSLPKIDFNSPDDFSPDNDVKRVAHKYWNWMLFPLSLKHFTKEFQFRSPVLVTGRDREYYW